MMLALTGSGEYLPPMEAVDRELIWRLGGQPRVVCLPTAAGEEGNERISYWGRLGMEHFTRLGVEVEAVPVVDRSSAMDPILAGRIARANFVYLSGGKPDYLHRTLQGSLAWLAVQQVLEAGGLLAGCSAGAMIMGEKFFGFPGRHDGFGLLPGVTVVPHFDEFPAGLVAGVKLMFKDLALVGVDGYTALVVTDGKYEVLGSGGVTVWDRKGRRRYGEGILSNWK